MLIKIPMGQSAKRRNPSFEGPAGLLAEACIPGCVPKGISAYCGYENAVEPGMWVGGIVGLKSILGVKDCKQVLQIMGSCKSWATLPIRWSQKSRF